MIVCKCYRINKSLTVDRTKTGLALQWSLSVHPKIQNKVSLKNISLDIYSLESMKNYLEMKNNRIQMNMFITQLDRDILVKISQVKDLFWL